VLQSFINYRAFRYAFIAAALCTAAVLAYLIHSPREPPNGSTWLGYTLGSAAALLVIYLALYGIRRRRFHANTGTAQGWLSAHVYLGIAALALATLHCGFQFGLNVHTAAWTLLLLVVVTGCWGVYAYQRYPGLILRQRGNASRESLFEELASLDRRARTLAAPLNRATRELIDDAIRRTQLGGSVWEQLRGRDRSAVLVSDDATGAVAGRILSNEGQHVLIQHLAREHAASRDAEHAHLLHQLLELAGQKAVLVGRLLKDIQLQGLLQFWLYIHLPLCFGLLAALIIHIVAVFLYW
jgi:hypothetical protein